MKYRKLGKTGLLVSEIGLGGIPIQKSKEKDVIKLIRKAKKLGVNFIDTGRAYTDSERKIGLAIKPNRKKWIIASKSPATSYDMMKSDIDESLKQLKTNYIDLYQLHHISDKEMLKKILRDGAYQALKEAKDIGRIKHIGITGHNVKVLQKAARTKLFETVMTVFNFRQREASKLISYCMKNRIGVIIMKPLDGGMTRYPTEAIRFCLSIKGMTSVIPGIHTEKELHEDIERVLKKPFDKEDEEKLSTEKIPDNYCRSCGYCVTLHGGCPEKINIMFFLSAEAYFRKFGPKPWLIKLYNKQPVKPSSCVLCGQCEKNCPYNLPIMRILRNLRISKYEKIGKKKIKKESFRKINYYAEKVELDKSAKKNLGKIPPPIVHFDYKKSANPGQRETVIKLIRELKSSLKNKKVEKKIEKDIVNTLCREMKIKKTGIKKLEDVVMLADYDNIVNAMRVLQSLIENAKK